MRDASEHWLLRKLTRASARCAVRFGNLESVGDLRGSCFHGEAGESQIVLG